MSDAGSSASGAGDTQTQYGRLSGNESDWAALGDVGERQGSKEIGPRAKLDETSKNIVRHLEIKRDIKWAARKSKRPTNKDHRTAYLLQRRGDVMQPACAECQQNQNQDGDEGGGTGAAGGEVFAQCVAAPVIGGAAFANGACANCVWDKKTCSLRGTTLALDGGSIRQFVDVGNDQFSLRDAIAAQKAALEEQEQEQGNEKGKEKWKAKNGKDKDTGKGDGEEGEASSSKDGASKGTGRGTDGRNIQTIPSSTFFGAFVQARELNRVGVSQKGPRCEFDGDELRFPISRSIWEDPKRLLAARSDLAHFLATVDARLYEIGKEGDDDSFFWRSEAKRLPALYAAPQAPKRAGFVQVPQTQEPKEKTPDCVPETQPTDETVIEETPGKETPKPPTPKPQNKSPVVPETQLADQAVIAETPVEQPPIPPTPNAPKPKPQKKTPEALKQQQQTDPALAVVVQNKPLSKDPKTGPKPGTSKNTAFEISDSQPSNDSSSSDNDLPKAPTSISRTIRRFNDSDDDDENAGVGGASPSTGTIRPLATTTATKTVAGGGSGKPPRSTAPSGAGQRKTNFLETALDALNSISGGVTGSKRRSGEGTGEEPAEKRPRGEDDLDPSVLGGSAA